MKAGSSASGGREGRGSESSHDIKIDNQFAALIPALAPGELAQLERSLLAEGCKHPLIVWKAKNILLDGHNRLTLCRRHKIPFKVESVEFPDRAAAEAFIVKNQLGRRNLSPEAAAYLRGKRYLQEKQSHGGARTKLCTSERVGRLKTDQRLAEEYKVAETTIRRDGVFARAVDSITDNCGEKARQAILARDTGLSRGAVARVARMKPKAQQKLIDTLLEKGKLPRRPPGNKTSITLPVEPKSCAEKLFDGLGPEGCSEVLRVLTKLIGEHGQ